MSKSKQLCCTVSISNGSHPTHSTTYLGQRRDGRTVVTIADRDLDLRFDLRTHSPDGFEWGYSGSGPAQLALALIADAAADDGIALRFYQGFKRAIICRFAYSGWRLSRKAVIHAIESLSSTEGGA